MIGARSAFVLLVIAVIIWASLPAPRQQIHFGSDGVGGQTGHASAASLSNGGAVQIGGSEELTKPCEKHQVNRKSELCAQWKAVDAAERAAFWTEVGALVAIVGFMGLAINLWFAGQTARAGVRAADAAAKATDLAKKAFDATHRPRLRVRHIDLVISGDSLSFSPGQPIESWSFEMANIGDSPVTGVFISYAAGWAPDVAAFLKKFAHAPESHGLRGATIEPGQAIKQSLPLAEVKYFVDHAGINGKFFVGGRIAYTDSNNVTRCTGFLRRCEQSDEIHSIKEFEVVREGDYEFED